MGFAEDKDEWGDAPTVCGESDAGASSDMSCGDELPFDVDACSGLFCHMCGAEACAPNPLVATLASGLENDTILYSKYIAWARYRPVLDELGNRVSKTATANYCRICVNVFNALGLSAKHKSISRFYKWCCQAANAHESRAFLKSRALWIKAHNQGDERMIKLTRLTKVQKEHMQADFSEYLTQRTDRMEFKGCEWDFVLRDHWDPNLDGEWDPKKAVTEQMFGKPEVGIWVRVGREGVYRAVRKATVGTVENTVEASGHDPFANEKKKQGTRHHPGPGCF